MADAEYTDLTELAPAPPRAREVLARRLADIVALPSSRITPRERWIVGDLLLDILKASSGELRARCAERLAGIKDAPSRLLRMLASDDYAVAAPILERSEGLTDFDMLEIARAGSSDHRMALARREPLSETVAAAIAAYGEPDVVRRLLKNSGALLASPTLDHLVSAAAEEASYAPLLIRRAELRPTQALRLFWGCESRDRRQILERFAVDRSIMIDAAEDVFPIAAAEGWSDPLVKTALRYIDRRQRDRAAAEQSRYGSLEGAIEALNVEVGGPDLYAEIARLAGVDRVLLRRVTDDPGGEALAVMCKATGLKWESFEAFWTGLGRDVADPQLEACRIVHGSLSVEKAQTVLRYWGLLTGKSELD